MTDPTLFSGLSPELEPHRHCTLDGREYRARVVESHGKVRLLVEYHAASEWREVRLLPRRADVARATGLGRWSDERRRIVLEDGREEGEAVHG
jgi:hypothetical protein